MQKEAGMAWEYSEKTKQLFMDAVQGKPGTHLGEIEDADGLGEHGSIACGDAMRFTFRVEKDLQDPLKDRIVQARYLTFGCTSAIAASEALCMLIEQESRTPIEALAITNADIVDYLGGLPEQKVHCSVMGAEALEAAVYNWAQKRGVDLKALGVDLHEGDDEDGRIVCKCFSLTEPYIRRKIKELELRTIPEITNAIKAGGACMACHHKPGGLQDLLDEAWGRKAVSVLAPEEAAQVNAESVAPAAELTPYQLGRRIDTVMEGYILPMLRNDGGGAEIVDIKEMAVYIKLRGACAGCAGAATTLKLLVERTLKEQVDERIRVISVGL
jgi:NifU-like protein